MPPTSTICERMSVDTPILRATRYLEGLRFDRHEPQPASFVIGAPRSGTTILHQALCYVSDVAYIDNLIARFHWYPELGISVSRELDYPKRWSGRSRFGATDGVSEPHEFGRFWLDELGVDSMVQTLQPGEPLSRVRRTLERMSAVAGKPFLFKVFTLAWHLADFHRHHAPGSRWVYIHRDIESVALSLLKLRRSKGSVQEWQSMVPLSALNHVDPYEQVVAQAIGIEGWFDQELARIPSACWIRVDHAALCDDFKAVVRQLTGFTGIGCDESRLEQAAGGIVSPGPIPAAVPGIDSARLRAVVRAFNG